MKKPKITIDTEVFFFHSEYGFFSDKISAIEETKAVFTNWPLFIQDGTPIQIFRAFKIAIQGIDTNPKKEKYTLMQYVSHGDGFDRRELTYFSRDKKEILQIYAHYLEYERIELEKVCDECQEKFQTALNNVGKIEVEETKIKNLLLEL